jgi:hypothetical protein
MLLKAALRAAPRAALPGLRMAQPVRHMGAGPVGYGSGPYRGLKVPKVASWHKTSQTVFGTILWLWLFYRFKNDGPALLVRAVPPALAHCALECENTPLT